MDKEDLVKDFVKYVCKKLEVENVKLSIVGQKDLDFVNGLCYDISDKEYEIIVKTDKRNITQIFLTLAHELVHVKQYEKQNLGHLLDNTNIPYEKRWWEIEAKQKAKEFILDFTKKISN